MKLSLKLQKKVYYSQHRTARIAVTSNAGIGLFRKNTNKEGD